MSARRQLGRDLRKPVALETGNRRVSAAPLAATHGNCMPCSSKQLHPLVAELSLFCSIAENHANAARPNVNSAFFKWLPYQHWAHVASTRSKSLLGVLHHLHALYNNEPCAHLYSIEAHKSAMLLQVHVLQQQVSVWYDAVNDHQLPGSLGYHLRNLMNDHHWCQERLSEFICLHIILVRHCRCHLD